MARILLAESDATARTVLGELLEADRHSVLMVSSALQLAAALAAGVFDAAIIDLALLRTSEAAVARLGATPVIAIEPRDQTPARVEVAVAARLIRPIDVEAARVFLTVALAGGGPPRDARSELLGPQGVSVRPALKRAYVRSRPLALTTTEVAVLTLLLHHRGEPVSVEDMARWIWGIDRLGSRNFVEAQISRLRRKLRDAGATDVIQTVRRVGYQVPPVHTR